MNINYSDFEKIDIQAGTIIAVEPFPEARKPAYKLIIDFGTTIGIKQSSAQITHYYKPEQLIGKQIAAVINFAPKQIGPFISEVLVLGFPDHKGKIVLITPDIAIQNGARLF
jgi:tRNA-binding protein